MVWESPEGIAEYKKLGKEYPRTEFDKDFAYFMQRIEWDPDKRETIGSISRLKVSDESEFLIYSSKWEGHDEALKNYDHRTRDKLGIYEKLEKHTTRSLNIENQIEERTTIGRKTLAYSIPFTKERLEELHKICNDRSANPADKTKYYVEPLGGTEITIIRYEDFLNGDFEDLHKNGAITITVSEQKKKA
jgi:hypothetical protein